MTDAQVITPWEVAAGEKGVDYDALIQKFGSTPINDVFLKYLK